MLIHVLRCPQRSSSLPAVDSPASSAAIATVIRFPGRLSMVWHPTVVAVSPLASTTPIQTIDRRSGLPSVSTPTQLPNPMHTKGAPHAPLAVMASTPQLSGLPDRRLVPFTRAGAVLTAEPYGKDKTAVPDRLSTLSRVVVSPCMALIEGDDVSSEPRITTTVVDHLESLIDLWDRMSADRVIDLAEQRELRAELRDAYATSVDADEGLAIGIATLRRGPDSERAKRLMGERRHRLRLVVKNDFDENDAA